MADIFTPKKRSWVMSRIRSRDTKIEKKMAQLNDEIAKLNTQQDKQMKSLAGSRAMVTIRMRRFQDHKF